MGVTCSCGWALSDSCVMNSGKGQVRRPSQHFYAMHAIRRAPVQLWQTGHHPLKLLKVPHVFATWIHCCPLTAAFQKASLPGNNILNCSLALRMNGFLLGLKCWHLGCTCMKKQKRFLVKVLHSLLLPKTSPRGVSVHLQLLSICSCTVPFTGDFIPQKAGRGQRR